MTCAWGVKGHVLAGPPDLIILKLNVDAACAWMGKNAADAINAARKAEVFMF